MFEILAKFFRFSGRENGNKFKLSMVIGLVEALASAMKIPAIMYILIGLLGGKPIGKYIGGSLAIMVIAIVIAVICKRSSTVLQTEGGYNASAFTRIKIAEHLRYLPMGYFNSNSIGEISSVTTNTMESLGDIAARVVMLTTQGILETLMIILMLLVFDWRIGLISAAGVLIFFGVNSMMQNAGKKDSEQKVVCDTELVSQIMEYLQGISEVKSYNLLGKQAKRLNDANDASAKINTRMEMVFVPYHFLQSVITKITGAVIVACSAYFYINGTMYVWTKQMQFWNWIRWISTAKRYSRKTMISDFQMLHFPTISGRLLMVYHSLSQKKQRQQSLVRLAEVNLHFVI